MSGKINVGFIGYGLGGRVFHTPLVNAVPKMRLHSVTSRSEEKRQLAQEHWGVKTVPTVEELLDDDALDLVVVSTPHITHRDLVIQCLSAGKHVVVDKVMAMSVAEAAEMIAAADSAGKLLNVFQNRRWDGDYLTVRSIIDEGLLGEVLISESCVVSYAKRGGTWRQSAALGGGPFRDWGAHLIDQLLRLYGPAESVWADFLYTDDYDVETAGHCHITHKSGARSVFECGFVSRIGRPRWTIQGTEGALVKTGLDPQEPRLKEGLVEDVSPRTGEYEPRENHARVVSEVSGAKTETTIATKPGRYVSYYENIADMLLNDAEPAVRLDEILEELAVIDAAVKSAATGDVVRL